MMAEGTGTSYIDAGRNEQTAVCTPLESSDSFADLPGGWYVVDGNVTIDGTLGFDGKTHLVLADGCKLTVKNIDTTNLTIYGQSQGTGTLIAGGGNVLTPAIGQVGGTGSVSITINGGCVNAYSDTSSATGTSYMLERSVIGGYYSSHNDSVIINGGVVYTMDVSGSGRNLPENGTTKNNCIVGYNGVATVYGNAGLPDAGEIGVASFADNLKSIYISSGATLTGLGKYTAYPIDMYDLPNEFDISLKAGINAASTDQEIRNAIQVKSPYEGHTGAFTIAGLTTENVTKITRNEDGTCTVTFTKNDKTVIKTLSLEKGKINSGNVTLLMDSYAYTGSPIEPEVTVTVAGKVLTKDKDYTVEYTGNTAIGTATVTVTGMGNYEGTAKRNFYINDADTLIDVEYVDEAGTVRTAQAKAISASSDGPLTLEGGWYFVQGTAQRGIITTRLKQDSFLILPDGCSLDVTNGLTVNGNLTIYGQSGNSGKLSIKATTGILASLQIQLGNLTVNGGNLSVENYILGSAIDLSTGYTFTYNGTSENFTVRGDFTSSGTLQTERLTEDMINVDRTKLPEGSSGDLSETVGQCVTLTNPTYAGKEFVLTGWTQSVAKVDDITYTVTYTHAQRGTVSKTVTLTPPCAHPNLTYQDKGDGTCGGTCPDCNEAVTEPHRWSGLGVCANCGTQAVAKAERGGTLLGYYGESGLDAALANSGNDGATFTLLANVEPNTCLTIQINCILNLGGHTITGPMGRSQCVIVETNTTVTIRGEGEITAPNGIALEVNGNVTLEGGTYTSGGSESSSVHVMGESATLSVTGEKVSIRNTSGGYGLIVTQAQSVRLSAGTYSGTTEAISSSVKLSDMLAHTDNIRYAYYQGDALVTTGLDGQALTGTVTVKECTHAYQYAHTTGTTTHSQTCPACGDAKASEKCDFSNGPCPCGAVLAVTLPADLNLTYNGTAQEPGVTVTVDGTPLAASNYEVTYADNINAGTNAAKVTATGKNYTGTTTLTFSIGKATLTVDGTGTASGVYGTKLSGLTVGGLTAKLGETEVPGAWKLTGDAIPNVGDTGTHEATFTPDNGADNYEPLTAQVTLNITPAPALTPTSGTLEVQNKQTKTYTYDLTRLLPALSDGKTLGDVTYTLGDVNITAGYYDSGTASISGTTLTLPIRAVDTEALADIGTVTVTITSQNYADMTATITVKSVNKTAVDITGVTLTGRAYNGSPIEYQQTAAASVDGSPVSVKGFVYTWNTPDGTAPVNAGNYTLTVSVDPEDPTYTGSTTIPVTIEQAEITITAPSRTIYVGGTAPTFSASDCTVTGLVSGESLKTPPTVAYEETPDTSKTGSVTVKASGAAVPDGGNYKEQIVYVDGTLTVKEPSSSGGGGGGDTPVNVTGVSLDRNSLTLTIGESFSLTVTITPSNADNKSVTWASSNPDVASVSGGTVTAVGPGTTTITVTTRSGGHTASCTVTVNAKRYTVTYNVNGGTGTMRTGSAADGEPFTLPGCTFTPPEGKVFDAWAIGSADGTQAKAGSSHTFTEDTTVYAVWKDAPLVTYAVTYNANGGTGTMTDGIAPDQEAFVLPECGFTAPEGKEFDCWAIGSATGPKVQPGDGYTFTANTTVYALWKDLPPVPYDITGIVWQNGEAVPGATVQLKRGADVVAAQTTGSDGSFTFSGVPAGVYNLVAIKDGITVTVMQEITSGSVNLTITLPNGKTNTVVEIKGQEGTPPVVVGEMEKLFTDDTVYTAEDKEIVATGGTVEFKMVVGKQDASSSAAIQIEASKPAGQTIGLFLDLSIIKTVTPKDGQAETTSVTQVGSLIETLIPLPDEMQGKASYTVYREHDGIVEALPNSGNGERYTVSSDKKSITIYARKYSTYAVAWSDNGGDTPVDPGKPSRPSGGGGSSVSTYAVTVSKTTYGKVVSSRTNASSGSTVTLTVTPDSGYTLDTLTVTDSRGNAVKLTDKGNGKYTFTMPSRAVTVTASFTPIVWNNPYADVAAGTWYYEAVRFVSENGLMGGYGKGLFGPNDTLTRAQFAQILFNKEGRPAVTGDSIFTDVAPGAWYADAVAWAAAEGIISGYGGGRFGPNDPITREQLAVMLWRYAGSSVATDKELHFNDANEISVFALEAMRWAVENGVMGGYGNGQLAPKGLATRAQAAQMLMNFLKNR